MISILVPQKNEPRIVEMQDALLAEFPSAEIIIATDRDGRGKGWAMRQAFNICKGDIIVFIDGDMDIHPRMIWRLLPFLMDYDIVVGKKQVRGIPSRRILTRLSRLFIHSLFNLGIDTQTGIKAFHREALLPWSTNGWMFDLEILALARRAGSEIIEVPVEANIERKMSGRSVVKCFMEAIRLWLELRSPLPRSKESVLTATGRQ